MLVGLPVISFICVVLLVIFIPVRRIRGNIANLAIVSWLVGCNLVHGVNAIIWADNAEVHVPVWCDIVTKLLLGATVALPGACLSISRRLELVSSTRPIYNDPKSQRNRLSIEFVFCYVIPIIYMLMHFIAQDHRFDLIKDFGCSASIHPSTPALTIMWLPPLVICGMSFILSGLAIHHSFRLRFVEFSTHIESRSPLNSSLFIRRISMSLITTGTLFIITLFSVFSASGLKPWSSWSSVHADMWIVDIVSSQDDVKAIQLTWWGIPVVSIVYILLSFTIGEETRDSVKWIRNQFVRLSQPRAHPMVMLPTHFTKTESEIASRAESLSTPRPKPEALELKSGWDDMLESKKTKLWPSGRKSPSSLRTATRTPSPTPAEDDVFIRSTMDYLESPVAKTLGITPPSPLSPPAIHISPYKAVSDDPFAYVHVPSPTTASRKAHDIPPSPRRVPADIESVISSVFDASWPRPPTSTPPSPSQYHSRSRSNSPVGSSDLGHTLRPAIPLSRSQPQPFQGSSITPVSNISAPPLLRPKRPSIRSLKRTLSGEKSTSGYTSGDAIIMTVVKETI